MLNPRLPPVESASLLRAKESEMEQELRAILGWPRLMTLSVRYPHGHCRRDRRRDRITLHKKQNLPPRRVWFPTLLPRSLTPKPTWSVIGSHAGGPCEGPPPLPCPQTKNQPKLLNPVSSMVKFDEAAAPAVRTSSASLLESNRFRRRSRGGFGFGLGKHNKSCIPQIPRVYA